MSNLKKCNEYWTRLAFAFYMQSRCQRMRCEQSKVWQCDGFRVFGFGQAVEGEGGDIMNKPRLVIAGTNSGAGKTTVSLGLMAALKRRGMTVQGFKVGPDYIDPSYHTAVTGRASRNLDTWMMKSNVVREVFHRGSEGADVSVIEGVMGMYDGKDPLSNAGSTAEVSVLLAAPVLLVVNVSSMARSAAAIVLGFQQLDPDVKLAGVIVNQVGSVGHYRLVKAAIEQVCHVPVFGYLTRNRDIEIPERHLGLVPALERGEMGSLFDDLAQFLEETVDVEGIIQLATEQASWQVPENSLFVGEQTPSFVNLAVARDSAFNFYYPENLELLEWYGASITYFRPLDGEPVPEDVDGLYIGGGFPEEFAEKLSKNREVIESVRHSVMRQMPILAECGGFMYLTESIKDKHGVNHALVGAIPAKIEMQTTLAALGYREVTALTDNLLLQAGHSARGHEFHYSKAAFEHETWPFAYETKGLRGLNQDGFAQGNILAAYTHLHFASNPAMVERFLQACRAHRNVR